MDFAVKVALSFLVGGAYVAGVIWLSENLGSRIGGAVAGLPSTILVGLIFIDVTEGSKSTQEAITIVPLIFLAALLYALVFLLISKQGFNSIKASITALVAWFLLVVPEKFGFEHVNFLIICTLAAVCILGFRLGFSNFSSALPKKLPLPRHIFALRYFVGGSVIAGAVVAARLAGPVWGGVVSSLPALLGSVLFFLNKSQGDKFIEGFIKRLPLSYFSSFIFLISLHELLPHLPDGLAFVVAMAGALAYTSSIILYKHRLES